MTLSGAPAARAAGVFWTACPIENKHVLALLEAILGE